MKFSTLTFILILYSAAAAFAESRFHPPVPLLDSREESVLSAGNPVSPVKTCGQCHDTDYITSHSYHVSAGLEEIYPPGKVPGGRPWDTGSGPFGRWDPLGYRLLTPRGWLELDLGTADWVRIYGSRHVGGGPAESGRNGLSLTELETGGTPDAETHVLNPETGLAEAWNWQRSGTAEMDCFLCHLPNPANQERIVELREGRFRWAATATLAQTGLVEKTEKGWSWNAEKFDRDGMVSTGMLKIQKPAAENCGICHTAVHYGRERLVIRQNPERRSTMAVGQVF